MFFFNDTATTEIYTLSLHDALPISRRCVRYRRRGARARTPRASGCSSPPRSRRGPRARCPRADRKSTRLNSSHAQYLVCRLLLEKKNIETHLTPILPALHYILDLLL